MKIINNRRDNKTNTGNINAIINMTWKYFLGGKP